MKDIFIIEGKKYISSRRASEMSEYSSDYIGQLCRANKLDCKMVGRAWFVTEESIHLHKALISREEVGRNRINNLKGTSLSVKTAAVVVNDSPIVPVQDVPIVPVQDVPVVPVQKSSVDPIAKTSPVIPLIQWTITTPTKGVLSPYIYSNDDRPLLPELKKKEVVEIKKVELKKKEVVEIKKQEVSKEISAPVFISEKKPAIEKIVIEKLAIKKPVTKSISESLIAKNTITYLKLTRQIILQRVIAPTLVLIVMFGIGTGTYIAADKIGNNIPTYNLRNYWLPSWFNSLWAYSNKTRWIRGYS
jgi:hypothetical protein